MCVCVCVRVCAHVCAGRYNGNNHVRDCKVNCSYKCESCDVNDHGHCVGRRCISRRTNDFLWRWLVVFFVTDSFVGSSWIWLGNNTGGPSCTFLRRGVARVERWSEARKLSGGGGVGVAYCEDSCVCLGAVSEICV